MGLLAWIAHKKMRTIDALLSCLSTSQAVDPAVNGAHYSSRWKMTASACTRRHALDASLSSRRTRQSRQTQRDSKEHNTKKQGTKEQQRMAK